MSVEIDTTVTAVPGSPPTSSRLLSADEFLALPEKPGFTQELIAGEVAAVAGASFWHGLLVELILRLLGNHIRAGHLGLVVGDNVGFVLARNPDTVRLPDAAFVSRSRLAAGGIPCRGFWSGAPDLAVEVVSPDDRASELHEKVRLYLAAGAQQVWVLWPEARALTVHRPGGLAQELGPDDSLDGGDMLPGFQVKVADLFAVEEEWAVPDA